MYQCILIATDGSDLSRKAVTSGISLAELTGAKLVVLKVVPRYPLSYFEGGNAVAAAAKEVAHMEQQWANDALAVVEAVKTSAEAKGVKAEAVTITSDLIAESIIAMAQKHNCDLIVMASHGRRGLKRLLLGSETMHVLTHSHIPVLVLR